MDTQPLVHASLANGHKQKQICSFSGKVCFQADVPTWLTYHSHFRPGCEFVNAFDTEQCKLTGVDYISSAYHPQTNRQKQTLQRSSRKIVNGGQNDWDKYIDVVLFAYCTSQILGSQDCFNYTPFYLMYGRHATLPIDILTDRQKTTPMNSEVQMTDEQVHEKPKKVMSFVRKRQRM